MRMRGASMRLRSLMVRVKTPTRWEYLDDRLRATPNRRKAAVFTDPIQALGGIKGHLSEGSACRRFEIREARFCGTWLDDGSIIIDGSCAVVESLKLSSAARGA